MTDPHQGPEQGGGPVEPAPRPGSVDDMMEEGAPVEPLDVAAADSAPSDATEELHGDEVEIAQLRQQLTERTLDLQRLQAEYVNYKRRVDRDRELVRQNATYAALTPLLDVLDDIDRARQAGELDGGFKGVAEKLERIVSGLGLNRFGNEGDPFDPNLHDALSHLGTDPEVSVTTCKHIAKAGYQIGDRVVRAAQVLVVDPEEGGTSGPEAG